jgi:hypothetical protein
MIMMIVIVLLLNSSYEIIKIHKIEYLHNRNGGRDPSHQHFVLNTITRTLVKLNQVSSITMDFANNLPRKHRLPINLVLKKSKGNYT